MKGRISTMLFLLSFGCLVSMATLSQVSPEKGAKRTAVSGVLDLSGWQPERDGSVSLSGAWAFHWRQLVTPSQFDAAFSRPDSGYFQLPAVWNGHRLGDQRLSGRGFATFSLKVKLPDDPGNLAIRVPRIFCAYRLWVDGRLMAAGGQVGDSPPSVEPGYMPAVVNIPPSADALNLILQVANFTHAKGGLRQALVLGARDQVGAGRLQRMTREAVLLGFLLITAVYHFALYLLRRQDLFNLYFGLVCFLLGLRTAFTGEYIATSLFGSVNWYLAVKLEWLTPYLAPSLAVGFFQEYFPKDGSRRVRQAAVGGGLALAAMVLASPPMWFTSAFKYMNLVIGAVMVYSALIIYRALVRRRPGAAAIACAYVLVFALTINDILYFNELVKTGFFLSYGLLLFIVVLSVQFSMRTSRVLIQVEKQAGELAAANAAYKREITERKRAQASIRAYRDRLEELVGERTGELEVANMMLREELADRKKAEREKQALQQQLQRAQKMEAIGTLAGGVAHDLNNILSGIVSYPELIKLDLPKNSPLHKPITTIQKSGEKAAAIVQDLLTLARRGVAVTEAVNLNHIVTDYLKSPEYAKLKSFNPGVRVATRLAEDLSNVVGSPVHLTKTIMNLTANAMESMTGQGVLTMRTGNQYIDRPIRGYDQVQAGDYVVFTIADQGIGIPEADIEHIFEPFYTKKKMGKSGTGLGMAVVWGTVKDHQGYIDVRSTRGKGTVFTLYFPVTYQEIASETAPLSMAQYMGRGESVLVVDDVDEQREIACGILAKLGYRARAVSSGDAAVAHLKTEKADLVILDMIMDPGISGLETYVRILEQNPGQKAIIASGFSETMDVKQAQRLGAGAYVKKPYALEKLGLAVQAELMRPAAPSAAGPFAG